MLNTQSIESSNLKSTDFYENLKIRGRAVVKGYENSGSGRGKGLRL
jgi:hypothetical protein